MNRPYSREPRRIFVCQFWNPNPDWYSMKTFMWAIVPNESIPETKNGRLPKLQKSPLGQPPKLLRRSMRSIDLSSRREPTKQPRSASQKRPKSSKSAEGISTLLLSTNWRKYLTGWASTPLMFSKRPEPNGIFYLFD